MDFTIVLDNIKKYYPIGINSLESAYWQHEGTALRENLCSDKINTKSYRQWKTFVKRQSENNGGVLFCDFGAPLTLPSYFGSYVLDRQKVENVTYYREIRFYVSVLSPYYTIYGLDKIIVKNNNDTFAEFEPLLYISPLDIYEAWFHTLRNGIERNYKDYEFLSFKTLKIRPKSLSVPSVFTKDGQDASVFNAFFPLKMSQITEQWEIFFITKRENSHSRRSPSVPLFVFRG